MDERQLREMHRYDPNRQGDHTVRKQNFYPRLTELRMTDSHTISESSDQPATLYLTTNLVH